jgi:hypothetical protein
MVADYIVVYASQDVFERTKSGQELKGRSKLPPTMILNGGWSQSQQRLAVVSVCL